MKINNTILRKAREKKGVSQQFLANELNLTQKTIWDWENKNCNVKLEYIIILSNLLNVEVDDLILYEKENLEFNLKLINNFKHSNINHYLNVIQTQLELIKKLESKVQHLENQLYKYMCVGGGNSYYLFLNNNLVILLLDY